MIKNSHAFERTVMKGMTPSLRWKGEDTAAWQKKADAKLRELLALDSFEKCPANYTVEYEKKLKNCKEIRFTFESEAGYTVPCHILLPDGVENPTPVICLQGHSTGMHISLGRPIYERDQVTISGGDRDFAVRAVKEGFAAITMEQRYMGEASTNTGTSGNPSCGGDRGDALMALLLGRCAIGERVWDTMRLIDLLEEKFPQLNMADLVCMGNSGGGTATFYAACAEKRIKTAIVSCAFCTYYDSIAAMPHCACNYVPNIYKYFDMGDLAALMAPRNFLVVAGKDDPIFPLAGVEESFALAKAFFEAAGVSGNCRMVVGDGAHRFYADPAWKVYREMTE